MKKNILICLEKLGIGGVETAVVNLAIALKEKGNNIIVMGEDGIYTQKLKENGIEVVNFKFELINCIDEKYKNEILGIIKKYDINQIHIHQFACIQYIWEICMENKIPYFAYVHSISMDDFVWFMNSYSVYKIILEPYFAFAQKIIVLSKEAIQNHQKYFPNIELSQYYILPNCINLDKYCTKKECMRIEKFALISRFSPEKMDSIINGIDLFLEYSKENDNPNIHLDLIGGGKEEDTIREYIGENSNITIIGQTNEIEKIIDQYDAIIGIGRCILEAITMKKIAVLSGIEKLKGIITPNNIDKILLRNFVGRELEDKDLNDIVEELNNLNIQEIKRITEENYEKVKNNLDIKEKISFIDEKTNTIDTDKIINYYIKTTNQLLIELDECKRKSKEIWDAKLWLEGQLNMEKQEKEALLEEKESLKRKKKKFFNI